MFNTSARSAMDDLPAPRHHEPSASDFYKHPYGGIARDVFVSREGFMRFWSLDESEMARIDSYNFNGKIVDQKPSDDFELLGYHNNGKYSITIIDRSFRGGRKQLARVMADLSDDSTVTFTQKGTGHTVTLSREELSWN